MKRRILILNAILFSVCGLLFAEAPLEVTNARGVRNRIPGTAEQYLGVPYVLGGTDAAGLDCSGLVYLVFEDATGHRIPRTVKSLYAWTERIPFSKLEPGDVVFFNTAGPLTHVGIYLGDSEIIHAASDGPKRGVILSSLDEAYYAETYYDVGRIIPSGGWIGLFVDIGGNLDFGSTWLSGGEAAFAGGGMGGRVSYNLFGLYPGVELRVEYDPQAHQVSVPFLLTLGLGKKLRVSTGKTLAFTDASFTVDEIERTLSPADSLINTFGIDYRVFSKRLFGVRTSLDAGFVWTSLEPAGDTPEWAYRDMLAGFKTRVGLSVQLDY